MNHVHACVLIPGSLGTIETRLHRHLAALRGDGGSASLVLRVPDLSTDHRTEIRLHLDDAFGASETRGMSSVSWAPLSERACPEFKGALLLWALDAQSSWMGIDGVFEWPMRAPAGNAERALAHGATVEIAFDILRRFESLIAN